VRALILGFFSTVGDLECLEVTRRWLGKAEIPCDVAPYSKRIRALIPGSVDPRTVDPAGYTHAIVVCGPCHPRLFAEQELDFSRFGHCTLIGLNLTMLEALESWNPFDVLLERDSNHASRPDLTFLEPTPAVPVVGRCLIDRQPEYGARQRHEAAASAIAGLIARRGLAVVEIDTRCLTGVPGEMRRPPQVLSLIRRVDFLLTTRLHGMVYALKAGVPVIAVDPVAGGDKVTAQARAIGWPRVVLAEEASPEWMDDAADWCLSPEAKHAAEEVRDRAPTLLEGVEARFLDGLKMIKPAVTAPSAAPRKRGLFGRWSR
jgi:hypothetical protein